MANSFFQNMLGGFAGEIENQNVREQKLQEQEQLAKYKKDEDYRNMVMSHSMTLENEKALVDYKSAQKRQQDIQDAKDEAAANERNRKAIFGEVRGAVQDAGRQPSPMDSQVSGVMNQPQAGATPAQQVLGTTSAPPQNEQANVNGQGLTPTGALPGTEGNVTGQPQTGNTQVAQSNGQPMVQPASFTTSTSPQPVNQQMQGHPSPEAATVQNPNMNNSSTDVSQGQPVKASGKLPTEPTPGANSLNVGGNQYGITPIDWAARDAKSAVMARTKSQLASLGVDTNNQDNVTYFANAPTPLSVLSRPEQDLYMTLMNAGKENQIKILMDNSPNVRAYRIAHGQTSDGEPMPDAANPRPNALLWDKTLNRPYGTLSSLNTYYEKEQNKINDKNSQVYKDITDVREQAMGRLENLGQQDRINAFTVNAPAPETKDLVAKLNANLSLEDKTAAFDAWAQHILGVEKRDIFSNTKGRVTNQEAQQFFKALPDLVQSREGRTAIIAYMKGQAARELEVANLKSQYLNDNNGLYNTDHASQLEQAYRAMNPIFSGGSYDVHNPVTMFNPNVSSSSNWLNGQLGLPVNPNDRLRQHLGLDQMAQQQQQTNANIDHKAVDSIGNKFGF